MKICPVCGLQVEDEARFCPRDGAVLETRVVDPFLGKILLGQFEVEELIGQGTTGSVYRARQLRMDRPVAIKVLRPELAREAVVVERFHREAKAVAKLSHPNIITVHLVAETDDGLPYLVMEYVQGEDLQELLSRKAPLPTAQIADLGIQIAEALAEAHAQGIVHRDLKPANIKLTERGGRTLIKVLDFGIAKILQEESQGKLTKTGTVFGTPHYVSPEQASGSKVDHRTDIYSLGVILFQMATGRLPFESSSGLEVLVKHIKDTPPRPSTLVGTVHPEVERLILEALSKKPEDRQGSARALAEQLQALAGSGNRSASGPAKSVQTLDMTGWQKKKPAAQSKTASQEISKGTKLAFGGLAGQGPSVAEQVSNRVEKEKQSRQTGAPDTAANGQATRAVSTAPVPPEATPSGKGAPPRKEQPSQRNPLSDTRNDAVDSSGVVVEPATDYASGKATSMSIPSASKIAAAPAPVAHIPREPDTLVDESPPQPEPPTHPPAPGPIAAAAPVGPDVGPDHPTPPPSQQKEASNAPNVAVHSAAPPSDWSVSDLDAFGSKSRKSLWIVLLVSIIGGAGLAGAYALYRHSRSNRDEAGAASPPPQGKAAAEAPDGGTETAINPDAGSAAKPTKTPTLTKGTGLELGQTKAKVTLDGLRISLALSRPAKAGRTSKIVVTVHGPAQPPIAAHLVTPDGALTPLRLKKSGARYRAVIGWKVAGLHRIVLSCKTEAHKTMVWFSIPVPSSRRHGGGHGQARRVRAGSMTMDPYGAEKPGSPTEPQPGPRTRPAGPPPTTPPPTPTEDEGLPTPPDERPSTPPPTHPRPRPSEDLPPPPPDDGA